ncbi:hypothetical protein BBP40_002970 [Aspergillus hancockii]|nr:hypothetical protein BBP40_002970 [Aspergillus hancockii]
MMELVETSKSMTLGDGNDQQQPLDSAELASLFIVTNVSSFISTFFHSLYWHLPVVHFPTFDPGNVSNPLLLSIFLTGAVYATPWGGTTLSSRILDVAEEYIFRKITSLSMTNAPSLKDLVHLLPTVQLVQSALIIEMLQFGQERLNTRRRIRIIRHPSLVSIMRSLGFFHLKRTMTPQVCDDRTWRGLVAEEVCIRLACWTFLADGFLTLWEAENAEAFGRIATAHAEDVALPPVREVVQSLLDYSGTSIPLSGTLSLCMEHLLILIYAISSLAFQARVGFFGSISLKQIQSAIQNWKQIWDSFGDPLRKQQLLPSGYPKHAKELWLLLSATLDAASKRDSNILYLDNAPTDDLGDLNEFIQLCSQST